MTIVPVKEAESTIPSDEEMIRKLAYELWVTRGCPIGSAEVDWVAAEGQLKNAFRAAA